MTHHQEKKGGFPLLQLALAAALAAGAGYYATHKEKVDKEAKKRIDYLAKMFSESQTEVEKRVRKVWGDVSKEAIAKYMDLRSQLLHELEAENLEKRGKMLRQNYEKLVDEVIKKARTSGILTPDVEEKLGDLFKMDWEDVQRLLVKLMDEGVKKTAVIVRKAKVASKVRAVKKTVKRAAKKTAAKEKKVTRKKKR